MTGHVAVGGHTITIGNPDKVFFPDSGITKRNLVDYYSRVAEIMVPHLADRPLAMHRFPDGIEGPAFFQKETPDYFPDWIRTVTVPKEAGHVTHVVCDEPATLVYLADQACVTPHIWLSTAEEPRRPERLVFDLDPPEDDDPDPVRLSVRAIRDLLDELSLRSRLMTTGSKGFHVVVPLQPAWDFDEVRGVARRCAELAAARYPDRLTVEQRKASRAGRVFVDYLRNAYAQTTVAPYAVRARPGAPVATPLDWEELGSTRPQSYTIENLFRRLGQKEDPWKSDGLEGQSLDTARHRLAELEEEGA